MVGFLAQLITFNDVLGISDVVTVLKLISHISNCIAEKLLTRFKNYVSGIKRRLHAAKG